MAKNLKVLLMVCLVLALALSLVACTNAPTNQAAQKGEAQKTTEKVASVVAGQSNDEDLLNRTVPDNFKDREERAAFFKSMSYYHKDDNGRYVRDAGVTYRPDLESEFLKAWVGSAGWKTAMEHNGGNQSASKSFVSNGPYVFTNPDSSGLVAKCSITTMTKTKSGNDYVLNCTIMKFTDGHYQFVPN